MAIANMKKISIACLKSDSCKVMSSLQILGGVEFINIEDCVKNTNLTIINKEDDLKSVLGGLSKINQIINILNDYSKKESTLKKLKTKALEITEESVQMVLKEDCWIEEYSNILSWKSRIDSLGLRVSELRDKIKSLEVWEDLDLSSKDLERCKEVSIIRGMLPSQEVSDFSDFLKDNKFISIEIVSDIGSETRLVIAFHSDEKEVLLEHLSKTSFIEYKEFWEEKPKTLVERLVNEISCLEKESFDLCKNLESKFDISRYIYIRECFENEIIKLKEYSKIAQSNSVSVIYGYIEEDCVFSVKSELLDVLSGNVDIMIEDIDLGEKESVPVKLKNNKFVSAFESITTMYSLPKYGEVDPTPLLAPFYFLFFGMMMADVGYGLIMIIGTLIALRKFELDEKTKKFIHFFKYLGISTMLWGVLYGSFFGDFIKFKSLLNPSQDVMTIMALAVGFGAIQVLFGLLVKAYIGFRNKDYKVVLFDVGAWIVTFIGIALFVIKEPIGLGVMIFGMVTIVLTGGRESNNVGGKLAGGLYSLYGITNYLGDLVSYTRLMALGIAGGSIAGALNLIIKDLPTLALFIIGPIIFILAHIFNLLLGALGAYVHSCRLQYVEYFSKFYDGGGREFTPFKNIDKEIKINKCVNNTK